MKVLISAFAISPLMGSEAGIGWEIVLRIAKVHQVTVICGDVSGNRSEHDGMQEWIAAHPETPPISFVYVPGNGRARFFERIHAKPGLHFLYYAAYNAWQKQALAVAQSLHETERFDLVHQMTILSYREPGYLWTLDIPFFWGPVSGRNNLSTAYLPMFRPAEKFQIVVRNSLNSLTAMLSRRVVQAARCARWVWCVTSEERRFFAPYTDRTSILLDTATPTSIQPKLRERRPGEPLVVAWSGIHMARKALPILIRAIAKLPSESRVIVNVLGAAREGHRNTEDAKKLAAELGVDRKFVWHGALPRAQAMDIMASSHVLVHTSLAEATSTVVMEALGSGMPVICHDICGMATAVDDECGIKVPALGPEESVTGFAAALNRFLDEPQLLHRLSTGAILRSEKFSWDAKIVEICAAYEGIRSDT